MARFSSFARAVRVIAYVYRFYNRTIRKLTYESLQISPSEASFVKSRLILMSQRIHFGEEMAALADKKPISGQSRLATLNPFIDDKGILRVGGRLSLADNLTHNEKHPIIIPYHCAFSKLIVQFIHDISLHGGNQLMLRLLRTQYWLIKAKVLIKKLSIGASHVNLTREVYKCTSVISSDRRQTFFQDNDRL